MATGRIGRYVTEAAGSLTNSAAGNAIVTPATSNGFGYHDNPDEIAFILSLIE